MTQPIIQFKDVQVEYKLDEGTVYAVRGASYKVYPDETVANGYAGQSCGKRPVVIDVFARHQESIDPGIHIETL